MLFSHLSQLFIIADHTLSVLCIDTCKAQKLWQPCTGPYINSNSAVIRWCTAVRSTNHLSDGDLGDFRVGVSVNRVNVLSPRCLLPKWFIGQTFVNRSVILLMIVPWTCVKLTQPLTPCCVSIHMQLFLLTLTLS